MGFQLPLYIQTGTATASVLREYITNDVWTKPNGLRYLLVAAVGAGGGGGAGIVTGKIGRAHV